MKSVIKWFFLSVGALILSVILVGIAFVNISPQFGGSVSDAQKQLFAKTGHYADGIFLNEEVINMQVDCHSIQQMVKEMLQPDPDLAPKADLQVQKIAPESLTEKPDSLMRLTWFGHSTFLIEWNEKIILFDPIFSQYAAPHHWFGRKRYHSQMPIDITQLPEIDAVIISHDHYDHLDYESIDQLKEKTGHFFVPLGVDNHLRKWDIPEDKISKMDWWDEQAFNGLTVAFTPSRHMSGRGLNDQSATLWGSWVLQSDTKKLYFSGDGGYGKHFKEIGKRYGGFDIALMECGQYNKLWADVHMMPEQTVQAGQDVGAKMIVPIHWGAFSLASHSWTDPIERVTAQAEKMNMPIATPQIGEPIVLTDSMRMEYPRWWEGK
ncbi:MAG: MBL fold metallo-hydrolase [Bacteroidota bacterium]